MLLKNYRMDVTPPECLPSAVTVAAVIEFNDDLTELLPYLNTELGPCVYEANIPFLRFRRGGKTIAIYPNKIAISPLRDEDEAKEVFQWVRETINSISNRKDEITPSTWSLSQLKPLDIFKLLPRTNCGKCKRPTCMAFAAAIASGDANPNSCPALKEDQWMENRLQLLKLFGKGI
jgi:ArsR family metal-binding transcriptional regulator